MSTTPRPQILWVDDDKAAFDAFSAEWSLDAGYELTFAPLDELAHENGAALQRHVDQPPAVLLMDWQDGLYERVYAPMRGCVPLAILMSLVPQEILAQQGVYDNYPELTECTLRSPFKADQLKALLPLVSSNSEESQWGAEPDEAERTTTPPSSFSLGQALAIRFLDDNLQPISKTPAWTTNFNRPKPDLREEARDALTRDGFCSQLDFGVNPVNDQFGLIQISTHRLSFKSPYGSPPATARYLQWVTPILQEAADEGPDKLATYGTSADGILSLMKTAGFERGRFYRLSDVSGLTQPLLELVARVPDEPELRTLPVAIEIDASERLHFLQHLDQWTNASNAARLILHIRPMADHVDSPNDSAVWNDCVGEVDIDARLEIPVLAWELQPMTSIAPKLTDVIKGLFVFDLGRKGEIDEKRINKPLLLQALKYFQRVRQAEETRFKRHRAEKLMELHNRFTCDDEDAEIEKRLAVAALDMLSLVPPEGMGQPTSPSAHRSAMFARYDEQTQELTVTTCTDGLMTGLRFGLHLDRFAQVRAAIKAMEALRRGAEAQEPIFEPNLLGMVENNPERAITINDWQSVNGCDSDLASQCQRWQRSVQTVVACPITSDSVLLGVLVVRSSAAFEFTRRLVDSVLMVAQAAKPYLARLRAEEHRKSWIGLVMHEMRRHLSRANNKIDVAMNGTKQSRRVQALNDSALILKSGHDLSQLFLKWLGWDDAEDGRATDADFWKEIKAFGQQCTRSHPGLTWHFKVEPGIRAEGGPWLGRVLMVLIDNAFTYADRNRGSVIRCTAVVSDDGKWIDLRVSNPGRVDPAALAADTRPFRAHVGTTLARRACQDVGATLHIQNGSIGEDGFQATVLARVHWPMSLST